MSGRIENNWSFFKKVKSKVAQEASPSIDRVNSIEPSCHSLSIDDQENNLCRKEFIDDETYGSAFHANNPCEKSTNNNWIVDNWFKTWPTREKSRNCESLSVNLNYKQLFKKNTIVSLDVITGSDDDNSFILSLLRSKKGRSNKMKEKEMQENSPIEDGSITLDSLLESLPLVYNPATKQLQLGRCKERSQTHLDGVRSCSEKKHVKSSSADAATLKEELYDEKRMLLLNEKENFDSMIEYEESTPSDVVTDAEDSNQCTILTTVPHTSTSNSLSFTDASSFSSLASSNTDLSLYSASDSAICLGRETPLNDAVNPKRKKGLAHFLSRNLFSWKTKEESSLMVDDVHLQNGLENSYPSSESLSSTGSSGLGWKFFSKSLNSKGKSTDLKAGTVGLIMEDRPSHLPAKTACEQERHKQEYEGIVSAIKKKEAREAKERQRAQAAQIKLEQQMASAVQMWNKVVIPKWNTMHKQKKTSDLWWLGIPSCTRGKVWKLAIGNELNITPPLYSILVQRSLEKLNNLTQTDARNNVESLPDTGDQEATIDLIQLDVSRTFPNLCIFQKGGPYHDPLHNILGAYVCYRPDIGYVQGMSFLAATLLLNMDEAEAFIAFANLLNNPVHMAFYSVDQNIMQTYYNTLQELIKENLPELGDHLEKLKVTPDLYFLDWVLTIFSRSVPLDISARIWDLYLRDGEEFLFRAAIGILKLFENELTSQECTVMTAQLLTRLPEDLNQDALFRTISSVQMAINGKPFNQVLQTNIKATHSH